MKFKILKSTNVICPYIKVRKEGWQSNLSAKKSSSNWSYSASTSASPSQSAPQTSDKDKSTDQIHKNTAPFPNRLRNNNKNMHIEKIFEMFNHVKLNVPLLDAIQQVSGYAKFLKDMCTKKRKTNVPKKVFLATNISELLSGRIPIKYKDPRCPTIFCIIGQTEISRALLDLGARINLLPLSIPASWVGRVASNSSKHSVS